jgi:hypothetical protein
LGRAAVAAVPSLATLAAAAERHTEADLRSTDATLAASATLVEATSGGEARLRPAGPACSSVVAAGSEDADHRGGHQLGAAVQDRGSVGLVIHARLPGQSFMVSLQPPAPQG